MSQKLAWLKAVHAEGNLSPAAKNVAVALFMHHNAKTGLCCPTQAHLGEAVALERRRINKVIGELKTAGWITAEQTRGASYYILRVERVTERHPAEVSRNEDTSEEAWCLGTDAAGVADPGQQVSPIVLTEQSTLTVHSNSLSPRAPVGTRPKGQTSASGGARVRRGQGEGSHWPANLGLDDHAREIARQQGITSDVESVWADFHDHALMTSRTVGDWMAAWRYWCRRAHERAKRASVRPQREQPKPSRFTVPRNLPPQAA
ncbi:MAG: helix-turn-helix domain-containing protein [Methylorubrum extorquens]|jgi:hypothetical protein|uniref:helix-turn-helix domain-containing protein n=1 Tax=Methylorubrum extorquens TaxID=408 RepID=UPI002FEE0C2C